MESSWLVRVENRKIEGPFTKEVIKKMIADGKIKDSDEVCAGNGFWFSVGEKELKHRFIDSNEKQPFNPLNNFAPKKIKRMTVTSLDDVPQDKLMIFLIIVIIVLTIFLVAKRTRILDDISLSL